MQLPILSGVVTDNAADFRTTYPVNCVPVPKDTGVSAGYMRVAEGIRLYASTTFNTSFGADRGGYAYNGRLYRLAGTEFYRVDDNGDGTGRTTVLKSFSLGDQATFDQSFDRLIICVSGQIWYFDDATNTFEQITDPDLGVPIDALFLDGYTVFTDGQFIGVTELNNRLAVDPLKYGSSEIEPDPVVALLKLRNELHALNRYTIEVFDNVGGQGFPFQRIEGAMIPKGCTGTHACCIFMDAIAFLGGGRNEAPSVYIGGGGQARKIATREIEKRLKTYTETQLSLAIVEARLDEGHEYLYIHLPDVTMVYDGPGSQAVGRPIWFYLTSGVNGKGLYRGRNFVYCYDKWICGDGVDGQRLGVLDDTVASHFGEPIGYEFATQLLYNEGRGAIVHQIELVCTPGRPAKSEIIYRDNYDDNTVANYSPFGPGGGGVAYDGAAQALNVTNPFGFSQKVRWDLVPAHRDGEIEVDCTVPAIVGNVFFGFILRTTGWTNGDEGFAYRVTFGDRFVNMRSGTNGGADGTTLLGTGVAPLLVPGQRVRVKVRYIRNLFRFFVNDVEVWQLSDSTYLNEGQVGLVAGYGAGSITQQFDRLTVRILSPDERTIWHSYTRDGLTWSQERPKFLGGDGNYNLRPTWFQCGTFRNYRSDKFRGVTVVPISFARVEAQIEPLNA